MAKELDYFGIRECIAESGKSKVSDMKAYVLHRYPNVDKKLLASTAKELSDEIKKEWGC